MTHHQQMIIEPWEREKSFREITETLHLRAKCVNDVVRNGEEIESPWVAKKKRPIACLRCNSLFASEGKYNRLCEPCRGYVSKYHDYEETFSIGRLE
jgi:hypothetical protein